jgi:hypothetical protein
MAAAETDADIIEDPGIVGETGAQVISGAGAVDDDLERSANHPDPARDPDLAPVSGGDVSDTPAAQSGTRGAGTGADMGTGGEMGITRPGVVTTADADAVAPASGAAGGGEAGAG